MSYLEIFLFGIIVNITIDIIISVIIPMSVFIFIATHDKVQIAQLMLKMDKMKQKLYKVNGKIALLMFIPFSSIIMLLFFIYFILRYGSINGVFKYKTFYVNLFDSKKENE